MLRTFDTDSGSRVHFSPDGSKTLNEMNPMIKFEVAQKYILRFGPPRYRYQTLDQIATEDSGLLYLDNLMRNPSNWMHDDTRQMIHRYLSEPVIAREIERLMNK